MPETKGCKASSRAFKQKVAEAEFGAAGLADQQALVEKVFAMELAPPTKEATRRRPTGGTCSRRPSGARGWSL